MSLILLHRLKFPIKDDVLLLMLFTLLCSCKTSLSTAKTLVASTQGITASTSSSSLLLTTFPSLPESATVTAPSAALLEHPGGYPIFRRNLNNDDEYYANVHRILRNSERRFRNENVRWKKVATRDMMERRLFKRDIAPTSTSSSISPSVTANNSIANINSTKILNYSNRSIEAINFSGLAADSEQANEFSDILVLNFSHNNISIVNQSSVGPFAHGLEQLDLSANRIGVFECAFGKLSLLNLSCNRLEEFSSENIRNLRSLDLSCNRLADAKRLNLGYLSDVQRVDLSCNELVTLTPALFGNTTNLNWLDLSCNRLERILKNYFFNLVNVETLLLAHNNITDIENDTFAYLPNLQYLDLAYNDIDAGSIRALQGIPDLIGLSVAFNRQLGSALQGFVASWSLKELDASGTGLCQIPAALAQSVHTLNVSHNHFQTIRCGDLDSYPLLQYADLSSNEIVDIEDDALGRLEILITLRLNNNKITTVPVSLPASLCNLFLQKNQITDIQPANFVQLINLEILDLSGNRLTYLPGLPLPRLMTLNLRESGLRGLSQSVVKTSPNLKDLLLERNPIKCTDLMGIAEWTTACRSERPNEIEMTNAQLEHTSVLQGLHRSGKCGQRQSPSLTTSLASTYKSVCVSEKLRKTGSSSTNELKQHDLWPTPKSDRRSNQFGDNTTESEAQHMERMNRKFGNDDGNSLNKSIDMQDDIRSRIGAINNSNILVVQHLQDDDNTLSGATHVRNNNYVGLNTSTTTTTIPTTASNNGKTFAKDMKAVIVQSPQQEKPSKRKWKNITKTTTSSRKTKPIKPATAATTSNLHLHGSTNPVAPIIDNQTSFKLLSKTIVGANAADLRAAPADAENLFMRNNVVTAKDNNGTTKALSNSNEFSSVPLPPQLPSTLSSSSSSSQSSSLSVQRKLEKIDLTTQRRESLKAANKKLSKIKQAQRQHQRLPVQELGHQPINLAAPATSEDYLKDEADAKTRPLITERRPEVPQQKLVMNGMSITKSEGGVGIDGVRNASENDKSDHLADSLTQMMTGKRDSIIFNQTGSHDDVAKGKQSNDNTTLQSKKDIRSEYVQQHRYKNKEIINRNTHNPIIVQHEPHNKSTNNGTVQEPAGNFNQIENLVNETYRNVQQKNGPKITIINPPSSNAETLIKNTQKSVVFGTHKENSNTVQQTKHGTAFAVTAATTYQRNKDIVSKNMIYKIISNAENNDDERVPCKNATQEKCQRHGTVHSLDAAWKTDDAAGVDKNLAITLPLADVVSHFNGNGDVDEQNRAIVVHKNDGHTINHSITTPSSSVNPYPRHHHPPQDSNAANNTTGNEHHNNNNISTSTSGLPEQWNDIRTTTGHPGLFIVIGVTIGMVVSLGLIHLYRCRKPWHRRHTSHHSMHGSGGGGVGDDDQYTPAHRDLLPMELLSSNHHHQNTSSTIQYTDSPIELW